MSLEGIELRCGRTRLIVYPQLGGSIGAFYSMAGTSRVNWFRPADPRSLDRRDVIGTAYIPLVPFSGRIRNARLEFGGKTISLPHNVPWEANALHGIGWQRQWHVADRDSSYLALDLAHDGSAWPWPFRATQHFRLEEDGVDIVLSLTNTGNRAMPAGIGLHPWFPATPDTRLTTALKTVWLVDASNLFAGVAATPPQWDFSRGREIAGTNLVNGFTGWDGLARIDWPQSGASLEIAATPELRHLVIYTPEGEPYFCVEPVSHSVDAFNLAAQGVEGNGTVILEPGGTLAGGARFRGRWPNPVG